MPRGQTASSSVGARLNPKLANRGGVDTRVTISSQYVNRREHSYGLDATTVAGTTNAMSRSGFTNYPGQPLKISQDSILGQTLNKFELGEQEKNKLTRISGVQYYK